MLQLCWDILDSRGDILSWLLLIVFLCWHAGVWPWDDWSSRCWFRDLSLLGEYFFLGFDLGYFSLDLQEVWELCIVYFPGLLSWCVHQKCLLLLRWVEKESWRRRHLLSIGEEIKEEEGHYSKVPVTDLGKRLGG